MKKITFTILASVLLLIPTLLFAYDDPPKGIFQRQVTNIEENVADFSRYSSTVPYNGALYNFIYYSSGDKIIVRILTPKTDRTPGTMELGVEKQDNISALDNVSNHYHQPAPVIYRNSLYCFFLSNNNKLGYSVCIPGTGTVKDSWQSHVAINSSYNDHLVSGGMVAVVLQNKLCVFYQGPNGLECLWAEDDALQVWHREFLDIYNGGADGERFGSLSAGTTYITYNNRREEIAMIGYVSPKDPNYKKRHKAMCARYTFNNGQFVAVSAATLISASYDFQCVALAEGSVAGDGNISGKCIQAFAKIDTKDNNHCSYRILRYRTLNTNTESWSKQESNLTKQFYEWADHQLNLTVANVGVPAGNICMKQFMCLIYRGYDDCDWPLNSAWAETDSIRMGNFHKDSTLMDPSRVTYIGYIEGAPPYYINHTYTPGHSEYLNANNSNVISTAEFSKSSGTSSTDEFKFETGIKATCETKFFKGEFKGGYMGKWENETKKTITITNKCEAGNANQTYGTLLYLAPILSVDIYYIYDMLGQIIDSTFSFYIKDQIYTKVAVPLKFNLNSSDPMTFFNRKVKDTIDLYNNYTAVGSQKSVDLTYDHETGGGWEAELGVETTDKNTNGVQIEYEALLGWDVKKMAVGAYGKFEYTSTSTTVEGSDIDISTNLNEPDTSISTDCTRLVYKAFWINPSSNQKNWWVPVGAPNSKLWCLTYEVIEYVLVGGKDGPVTFVSPSEGDQTGETSGNSLLNPPGPGNVEIQKGLPATSGLSQNYPNPFKGSTEITYAIGAENTAGSMTSLNVYDLNGSKMATLVNENKMPGIYKIEWDASKLTPGIYFYSLQSGSFKDVKKLVLLK